MPDKKILFGEEKACSRSQGWFPKIRTVGTTKKAAAAKMLIVVIVARDGQIEEAVAFFG